LWTAPICRYKIAYLHDLNRATQQKNENNITNDPTTLNLALQNQRQPIPKLNTEVKSGKTTIPTHHWQTLFSPPARDTKCPQMNKSLSSTAFTKKNNINHRYDTHLMT